MQGAAAVGVRGGGIAPSIIAAGGVLVGLYACVLYQRRLQLKRNQMYMDGFMRVLETLSKIKRMR